MLKIDLHLHSTFSDGILAPEVLVRSLKKNGVAVASLTDHDTVEGVTPFLEACRRYGVRSVAGVELSAAFDGVLHILGYRFDPENAVFLSALQKNRAARDVRNVTICKKLQELGCDVTLDEARAIAGSDVVGRPHIARILWEKGYVPNLKAAFDRYLARGAEAYVPRPLLAPVECIRLIRDAGGLPVMAHPFQTTSDPDDLSGILEPLKKAGLWGLECWSPGNSAERIYHYLKIADRLGLYPTAGSDFHGGGHSSARVGVAVGEDILPWARFCKGL